MSERATDFIQKVWDERNGGADTEEKLVSAILKLIPGFITQYNAQNGIVVLDSDDLIKLSKEIEEL